MACIQSGELGWLQLPGGLFDGPMVREALRQGIGASPILLNPRVSVFGTPVSVVTAQSRTRGMHTEW